MSEPAEHYAGSWYLDPLVAHQKSRVHRRLVLAWAPHHLEGVVLKTDLFEEANGEDHFFTDVTARARLRVGVDWAPDTTSRASQRFQELGLATCVTDVRAACFSPESFDLIVSNSTLDHFADSASLGDGLDGLCGLLKPGGRLIVTLDNPWNPLYWALRWLSRYQGPFVLGRTLSLAQLERRIRRAGLDVAGREYLIHNPRLVSTALFLLLRRLFGASADPLVRFVLTIFSWGGNLPTRRFSAAFVAVCAERPSDAPHNSQAQPLP